MTTETTPLDAARQHLDRIIAHIGMGDSEAEELRAHHEMQVRLENGRLTYVGSDGTVRLDADRHYADLGTGPWVKAMEREMPHLFAPKSKPDASTADPTPKTATDLMQAVRSGFLSPDEAASWLLNAQAADATPPKPNATAITVTEAMIAARRGEPAGIAYLANLTGGVRR